MAQAAEKKAKSVAKTVKDVAQSVGSKAGEAASKVGGAVSDATTYVSEYGDRKEAERQRQDAMELDKIAIYLATNPQYAGKEMAQRLFLTEFSLTEEQTLAILLLAKQKYEASKKN